MTNILIIVFLLFLIIILNVGMTNINFAQHFGGSSSPHMITDTNVNTNVNTNDINSINDNISKLKINNAINIKQNINKLNNKKKKSISFNPKIKVRFFDKQSRQILYDQTGPI